jgi:hypothetical protein
MAILHFNEKKGNIFLNKDIDICTVARRAVDLYSKVHVQ